MWLLPFFFLGGVAGVAAASCCQETPLFQSIHSDSSSLCPLIIGAATLDACIALPTHPFFALQPLWDTCFQSSVHDEFSYALFSETLLRLREKAHTLCESLGNSSVRRDLALLDEWALMLQEELGRPSHESEKVLRNSTRKKRGSRWKPFLWGVTVAALCGAGYALWKNSRSRGHAVSSLLTRNSRRPLAPIDRMVQVYREASEQRVGEMAAWHPTETVHMRAEQEGHMYWPALRPALAGYLQTHYNLRVRAHAGGRMLIEKASNELAALLNEAVTLQESCSDDTVLSQWQESARRIRLRGASACGPHEKREKLLECLDSPEFHILLKKIISATYSKNHDGGRVDGWLRAMLQNEEGYIAIIPLEPGSLLAATPQCVTACSQVFLTVFFQEIGFVINATRAGGPDLSAVSLGRPFRARNEQEDHAYMMLGGENLRPSFFLETLQGDGNAQRRMCALMLEALVESVVYRHGGSLENARRTIIHYLWRESSAAFKTLLTNFYNEKRRIDQLDTSGDLPLLQH